MSDRAAREQRAFARALCRMSVCDGIQPERLHRMAEGPSGTIIVATPRRDIDIHGHPSFTVFCVRRSRGIPALRRPRLPAKCGGKRPPEVKIYEMGDRNASQYVVVSRPWVDSWRSAFWVPTYPSEEQ